MTSGLTPFAFDDALVRAVLDDAGDPWFCAKDVALALGYQWAGIRNVQHVPDEWRRVESVSTLRRGEQELWFLSEHGLYFFLGRSDKPGALPFQKWLAGEVLPSIRKTGGYGRPAQALLPPELPPIPEEALALRPAVRQRLWQDALQTARLDNAGSDAAALWFAHLCRMMAHKPASVYDEVGRFFHECCVRSPGRREKASDLYEAFRVWRKGSKTPMPSMKAFGQNMQLFTRSRKSSGMVYCDIALLRR